MPFIETKRPAALSLGMRRFYCGRRWARAILRSRRMERLGLRCLNSFFEFYLPELFPGKLTVYAAAFAGLAALAGWVLLLCGKRAGITVIFAVSVLPFFKSILIFVTSVLALFSAADFGAQALAFAKDLVTFVTAGLPIGLMLFWKGRGY